MSAARVVQGVYAVGVLGGGAVVNTAVGRTLRPPKEVSGAPAATADPKAAAKLNEENTKRLQKLWHEDGASSFSNNSPSPMMHRPDSSSPLQLRPARVKDGEDAGRQGSPGAMRKTKAERLKSDSHRNSPYMLRASSRDDMKKKSSSLASKILNDEK